MDEEKITCSICGKEFKDTQGLSGHMRSKHKTEQTTRSVAESKAVTRYGSLDLVLEKLRVPAVPEEYNGQAAVFWEGFNKGVTYGANTILAGIRSAQELSSLGIAQATPIIKMAQEMRQAEGQAAQQLAAELAQVNMQSSQQVIDAINRLANSQPGAPNPMAQVFADTMKPFLQGILQRVMSGVLGGFKHTQPASQPQEGPGQQTPSQSAQPQPLPADGKTAAGDAWGTLPPNVSPITGEEDLSDA